MFRTVAMCYSARANPEDIKKETGFKVSAPRRRAPSVSWREEVDSSSLL